MQFLADVAVLTAAFLLAYLPAINIQLGEFYLNTALSQLPLVIFVQFSALFVTGSYSILWRYVSIEDIKVFIRAFAISGAVLIGFRFALIFTHFNLWQVPVSVIVIDTVLAFGGLLGLRIARRFVYELGDSRRIFGPKRRVKRKQALVVGAGRIGAALAKEVAGRGDSALDIRGFVDDDVYKQKGSVSGIKVLGTTHDLPRLVDDLNVEEVVIALDDSRGKDIRRIMEICSDIPVKAQIVPSLNEIAQGRVSVNRIRDVQIEDLLGRDPVKLDDQNLHDFLTGRTVMVTGAGGSIGSELVRQITRFKPKTLLLVERAEYMLFQIGRELDNGVERVDFIPLLADIGDEPRMREIFDLYTPDVILHAAAHKHVPLMEANSVEAIKNNVFATKMLGQLAGECGVKNLVVISTDKAVNPTSIMGASKRISEIVVQDLNQKYDTNYVSVRFGNVLGSAGSVVPIFREQIQKGEPITVTDPEMKRYFMTIPEAAQLVLQAGALGNGGEIFILDMGEPVKILDLAEDMIRLSGLTPYEDIDIVFSGIRKGEKLFEELEITGEDLVKTRHPKIYIGKIARHSSEHVERMLGCFERAVREHKDDLIRQTIKEFVPESNITFDTPPEAESKAADTPTFSAAPKLGMAEK